MQKMIVIDGKEECEGYEFLAFGVWSERIDGQVEPYTVVICKDSNGFIEQYPIGKVRFV